MKLPKHIHFLLGVYLMGILFFTGFRLLAFSLQWDRFLALPDDRYWLLAQAFFMGWRFDTVISGYLLALPVVFLTFSALTGIGGGVFYRRISIFLCTVYSMAFAICAVDAPYFQYFFSRINTAAFNWFNTPDFVFNVLLDEWLYIILLLLLVFIAGIFWKWIYAWHKRTLSVVPKSSFSAVLFLSLVFMGLTFLGIRGRLDEKSPIRVGTAAFSTHALPNQLGLNPVFTLIRSGLNDLKAENRVIRYMEDKQAVRQVRSYLKRTDSLVLETPISRKIQGKDSTIRPNIVVVMLESMSAEKMGRYGHPHKLTPFIDSLATISYTFDSIYTAGIHTYNGLYSTLFSMPALRKQHSMNVVPIPKMQGLPTLLKGEGYQTVHFMTHDDQFDNVAGFFSTNGYERIVSKTDYPVDQIKSTLGVPDHYMFDFSMPILNDLHKKGQKPFFASFMTTSDHVPYILPEKLPYTPRDLAPNFKIIEYVDWSVRQFIEQAAKEPWFENTLFVLLADHGQYVNGVYDMPLSYHHTPLIFYAPKLLGSPKSFQDIGLQIDVFPTIMGILGNKWVNHTMGIDLLNEKRPFAFFSANNKYGVLGKEYYLVVREDGNVSLYKYKTRDTKNYLKEQAAIAKQMRDYAETMIHVAQMMKNND